MSYKNNIEHSSRTLGPHDGPANGNGRRQMYDIVLTVDVRRSNVQVHCGNNDLSALLVAGTAAQGNVGAIK